MQVDKMTAKDLRKYVKNLEIILTVENDEHNIKIFTKWLEDAKAEQEARFNRRMNYLRGGNYGQENTTRRLY